MNKIKKHINVNIKEIMFYIREKMIESKNDLVLNPDYYCAHSDEDENSKIIDSSIIIKLLTAFIVLGIFILAYHYFVKNNSLEVVDLFTSERVLPSLIEEKEITSSVQVSITPKEVKKVYIIKKEEDMTLKNKSQNSNDLSDEYIRLVQESLGKY